MTYIRLVITVLILFAGCWMSGEPLDAPLGCSLRNFPWGNCGDESEPTPIPEDRETNNLPLAVSSQKHYTTYAAESR